MSRVIFEPKLSGETVSRVFDFLSRLSVGETISTAVVTAAVHSGVDASPSGLLSGSASISGSQVTQKLTAGTVGVTYLLLCTITTSASKTLQLSAFQSVTSGTA